MNLLSETYLSYSPVHIESLIGDKGNNQKNMRSVAIDKLIEYAVEDADVTYQLKNIFEPKIKSEGLWDLLKNIEMPLISVLAAMERHGVRLNLDDLKEITSNLREDIIILEKEIYALAGIEFNISSPKQLGDVLFDDLPAHDRAGLVIHHAERVERPRFELGGVVGVGTDFHNLGFSYVLLLSR